MRHANHFQWCPNLDGMEETRYCALILSRYDRLRLLHVPSNLLSVIRDCVSKQWYLQLLKQKDYHGTTELKLGGCPWWADGNDAVEARYFISSLVGTLKSNGWEVCGTIDLSRHNNDKSTLLLRQCRPSFAPHMCVSFNKANRIRLIVSRYVYNRVTRNGHFLEFFGHFSLKSSGYCICQGCQKWTF